MGLVDYASDDSGSDEAPPVKVAQASDSTKAKPQTFQKVVDRGNPGKIRVSLPSTQTSAGAAKDGSEDEPDRKRIKLGSSGGLRGINAFLPAPKRAAAATLSGAGGGSLASGRSKGLAPGTSLKTGAEPAFSRQAMNMPTSRPDTEDASEHKKAASAIIDDNSAAESTVPPPEEFQPKGKATRFMPLSVSRKPKPKANKPVKLAAESAALPASSEASSRSDTTTTAPPVKLKPKISLFSTDLPEESSSGAASSGSTAYEPLLYNTAPPPSAAAELSAPSQSASAAAGASDAGGQSLDAIASDLNLSASERRQLFGRAGNKKGSVPGASATAINVVNFNTDAEYAANEELRASGEQPEQAHRVVRTVNTSGKNSLRSLVNVVAGQGDALEDHFAKGRRSKNEAGSKYGF